MWIGPQVLLFLNQEFKIKYKNKQAGPNRYS